MNPSRCLNESVPPLLRGIGTVILLLATVLSAATARGHGRHASSILPTPAKPPVTSAAPAGPALSPELARELAEIRREIAEDSMLEEVFENPWFEACGYAGTACIASSFFVEWAIRRRKLSDEAAAKAVAKA
jgi:hypothetical protein